MITVQYILKDWGFPERMARYLPTAMKIGAGVAFNRWRRHTLPDHFETVAYDRYGYALRRSAWLKRSDYRDVMRAMAEGGHLKGRRNRSDSLSARIAEFVRVHRRDLLRKKKPLVKSGKTRLMAGLTEIKVTAKRATAEGAVRELKGRIATPPYTNYRPATRKEILTMTPGEQRELEEVYLEEAKAAMQAEADKPPRTKGTVKV